MNRIPIAVPPIEPNFTNIKCCKPCPSNVPFERLDQEAKDSYLGGWEEYMRDFKCAFRKDGMCKGHAVNRLKYKPDHAREEK